MPPVEPTKLVVRTGVLVELAVQDTATGALPDTPGAYTAMRPTGTVALTDSRGTFTVSDFSVALTQIDAQIQNGRTVGASWSANLVPSDTAYTGTYDRYNTGVAVWLRVTFTDSQGTPVSIARVYKGYLTQWNESAPEGGAATVAVAFSASKKVS